MIELTDTMKIELLRKTLDIAKKKGLKELPLETIWLVLE